ncbi:MAG: hypothetical protein GY719_04435 [bacterium]|nr:hypothetical protein [bacterium]
MHSESWARRLLREMDNPRELLRRRRYWTPVFLRLYLDHVEEIRFRDPQAGLKLAKVGPRLALLVPESPGTTGRREHRENLVRAHLVLAGAYRVAGRDVAADSEYEQAEQIADSETLSPIARADLSLRLATRGRRDSLTRQRCAEALELVDAAAATYRVAKDGRRLAEAHAVRGYILNEAGRFAEATQWHGQALTLALRLERAKPADPADRAALARVAESARTNMAHAVSQSGVLTSLRAFEHIGIAHRELHGRRNSLTRHLLQWTEGKLYQKLNRQDRAETRFKVARRGFVRLEVPWEIALVSLDLAALYRASGQWAELETLAADTFRRFRELCGDFEAIAALSLWVDAVEARKGAAAAIDTARGVLEARSPR